MKNVIQKHHAGAGHPLKTRAAAEELAQPSA